MRARMLATACGYPDADDLGHLRTDPGFKLACWRLPADGARLCSQSTVSRWANAPSLHQVARLAGRDRREPCDRKLAELLSDA